MWWFSMGQPGCCCMLEHYMLENYLSQAFEMCINVLFLMAGAESGTPRIALCRYITSEVATWVSLSWLNWGTYGNNLRTIWPVLLRCFETKEFCNKTAFFLCHLIMLLFNENTVYKFKKSRRCAYVGEGGWSKTSWLYSYQPWHQHGLSSHPMNCWGKRFLTSVECLMWI